MYTNNHVKPHHYHGFLLPFHHSHFRYIPFPPVRKANDLLQSCTYEHTNRSLPALRVTRMLHLQELVIYVIQF